MNKWIELLMGVVILIIAVYAWGMNLFQFGDAALILLKGGIVWMFIGVGIILIFLGISDLKE
jgi:hypothetical protein